MTICDKCKKEVKGVKSMQVKKRSLWEKCIVKSPVIVNAEGVVVYED